MAHHGTLAGELLMLICKWCHGWAHQRRMKPSNRSSRYIYFHRSGQRHVEICLDSWNLFVFHGFITYHITPHHIKSHNLLLLQLPPPSFPKMSFPILFHSFPIVFPWFSRLFLLFLHLYGSDLMDLATFSSSMAIMPRGAMKPIATWNTTGSSYWYSQIFIATVIYI